MPSTHHLRTAHVPRRLWVRLLAAVALALPLAPTAHAEDNSSAPTHVVQPGETLWQIAQDTGVDTAALLGLNGIDDGDLVLAGQVLRLAPAAPLTVVSRAPAAGAVHTVAEGETLSAIALAFGVSMETLLGANSLNDADLLSVGMPIRVPGAPSDVAISVAAPVAPPAATATADPAPPRAAPGDAATAAALPRTPPALGATAARTFTTTYVVQAGETLAGIARQHGVALDTIARASGLDNPNRLAVGATLKIPVPVREHVVAAGETMYGIAATERIDLGTLIDFNEITNPALIRAGQVLAVPGPAPQAAATVATPNASVTPPPTTSVAAPVRPPSATPAGGSAPGAKPTPTATPSPTAPPARRAVQAPPGLAKDGVVGEATKLLGLPYVFGGSGPSSFDCSGLVWYATKMAGKPLPRGLFAQYAAGSHPTRDDLKPGDLVFFQNTYIPGLSHNGIYIGNGQFLHAADEQTGVTISTLSAPYWASRFYGATRVS